MSRFRVFIYLMCLVGPTLAGAVPAHRQSLPPVTLQPVALGHASTRIDFNTMIDDGQVRGLKLQNRLRTKLRGRSLHLTRGHVHIVKSEPTTRTQASVPKTLKKSKIQGRRREVQLQLLPQPAPNRITRNGN